MGRLIVFDGLDGSGKGTQSELLYRRLLSEGYNVRKITFPDYGSDGAKPVELYLSGGVSASADGVNSYAASSFYAVDRYIYYMREWRSFYNLPDSVTIADRYTTANAIHQLPKLPRGDWDGFLDWLFDYEWNKLALPRPDAVIYLDTPVARSIELIAARSEQTGRAIDIHENAAFQIRSREAAEYAATRYGWITISSHKQTDALEMESREAISDKVYDAVKPKLR